MGYVFDCLGRCWYGISLLMRYGSVCSGIEAASVAWGPLGWEASFLAEIAPFPRAVLAHHYPDVPLRGDFTEIQNGDHEPIDVLVGGTPCQSFSVAGLRGGMADERGNLALEYIRLAERLRPRWIVWENVPGILSSGRGRDFGSFLGGLAKLGYGFAYRVLDAQYFGLAQRRKRVFVVGYLGDWRRAAAVLFEPASLRGDTAPRRESRKDLAPTISSRPTGGGGLGTDFDLDGGVIASVCPNLDSSYGRLQGCSGQDLNNGHAMLVPTAWGGNNTAGPIGVATACNAHGGPMGRLDFETETFVTHALRGEGHDASEDGTGRGTPIVPVLAFDCKASGQNGFGIGEVASTLRAMGHADSHQNSGGHLAVQLRMGVRRLTPRECERLQGFPDDYTAIPWRKGVAPDGPRYKALGNSMAVPCMAWIGRRIDQIDGVRA